MNAKDVTAIESIVRTYSFQRNKAMSEARKVTDKSDVLQGVGYLFSMVFCVKMRTMTYSLLPTVRLLNGIPVFSSGTYCDLPQEYSRRSNVGKLTEFYSSLLASQDGLVCGTDPLGFDFVKKDFLCYTGLVCGFGLRSQFNRMRKKHPDRVFKKEYILARIESEYGLKNFEEFIPIDAITQNIHELRGLNGKISAHIDAIMGVRSEADWEEAFERASDPIKKIYVGSRLIKFILDNTRFFNRTSSQTWSCGRAEFQTASIGQ